ncbi:MAG: hypothetical protein AAGB22_12360 [Bacteroidota bacterium]
MKQRLTALCGASVLLLMLIGCFTLTTNCSVKKPAIPTIALPGGSGVQAITPIQRLGKCTLINGNFEIVPVTAGSVTTTNVHVITHGWAPNYKDAVETYKSTHSGQTLLAWYPEAVYDGVRFFVPSFTNLAQAIMQNDPASTVLVFSWIDQSATEVSKLHPINSRDSLCAVEGRTRMVAGEFSTAVSQALSAGQHKLHLLGHSFGTKVVSLAGVDFRNNSDIALLHLTLFDSPERASLFDQSIPCADNHLEGILPGITPNRTTYFVDNYISYWDKCLSTAPDEIVDVTLVAQNCTSKGYEDCLSCAHEFGVNWYTAETWNPRHQYGLWWSPMVSRAATGLSRFYILDVGKDTLLTRPDCQDGKVVTCW